MCQLICNCDSSHEVIVTIIYCPAIKNHWHLRNVLYWLRSSLNCGPLFIWIWFGCSQCLQCLQCNTHSKILKTAVVYLCWYLLALKHKCVLTAKWSHSVQAYFVMKLIMAVFLKSFFHPHYNWVWKPKNYKEPNDLTKKVSSFTLRTFVCLLLQSDPKITKKENRQNVTFGQLIVKPSSIVRLHINCCTKRSTN